MVGRPLLHHQPGVMAGRDLLAQAFGSILGIDRLDLAAGGHHVVHRNALQFQQIDQDSVVFARQSPRGFEHDGAQFLQSEAVALPRFGLANPQCAQNALHEQVDEPDDRIGQLQQGRQYEGRRIGNAFRIRGAHHFGGHFAEHQNGESQQQRSGEQDDLAVAEQTDGQHGRQRSGCGVDQIVAQQDDAEQLVGAVQQGLGAHRAAYPRLRGVPQAIAVDRHHRGFGCGEESRRQQQNCQHDEQRLGRETVQPRASALENHLEHELRAQVGQQQKREPCDRPVQRRAAAPAAEIPPQQQAAEHQP